MTDVPTNSERSPTDPRERVLIAAESLFAEKGFGPVTLRQIGTRAGIHHSSLYHHVPGGKADLFVEVMERIFARHEVGIMAALVVGAPNIRTQLHAVADWMLAQAPIDLVRMQYVDMPELNHDQVEHLTNVAYRALQQPIILALEQAHDRGQIVSNDFVLISGGLLGMIQSLYAVSEQVAGRSRPNMARHLIDVFLNGLYAR